jgi:transposase
MRYELADYEWSAIKPMLPNKPRGVPRVNDRRVLNGIFWVLRSGAPWRDLLQSFGPYTTCYNRFVRWRRAGVWSRIMNALATTHDASVQMIDTSIVHAGAWINPSGDSPIVLYDPQGAGRGCKPVASLTPQRCLPAPSTPGGGGDLPWPRLPISGKKPATICAAHQSSFHRKDAHRPIQASGPVPSAMPRIL